MSVATPPPGQYTVLRIKRKANEAPLSSLVISDERAVKRRDLKGARGRGVFRLAETVPHTWKGEGAECEMLKSRIEGLLRTMDGAASSGAGESLSPIPPVAPAAPAPPLPPAPPPAAAPIVPRTQYRVVPRAPARNPNLPPRVITNAEIEAMRNDLLFVDATAVERKEAEEDPEMAAFLPMLKEYLKMEHSVSTPPPLRTDDDEYVYDLYYRDVAGDATGADVGALLGYEDLSPPSTPPDSEPEDEADEDSNDEDYYRNDYPEDEDADEDMEGFEDAFSDGAWSHDSEADREEEERETGLWDYR